MVVVSGCVSLDEFIDPGLLLADWFPCEHMLLLLQSQIPDPAKITIST